MHLIGLSYLDCSETESAPLKNRPRKKQAGVNWSFKDPSGKTPPPPPQFQKAESTGYNGRPVHERKPPPFSARSGQLTPRRQNGDTEAGSLADLFELSPATGSTPPTLATLPDSDPCVDDQGRARGSAGHPGALAARYPHVRTKTYVAHGSSRCRVLLLTRCLLSPKLTLPRSEIQMPSFA